MPAADLEVIEYTAIALLLGWVVGYERVFRGRAAGTQVYCLVSMACCALTAATGLSPHWFGRPEMASGASTTALVGCLLTGIGFLGAGIIMRNGTNVRGLTTAASIWATSAIGILVGIHFLLAAVGLTAFFVAAMVLLPKVEGVLPGRAAMMVTLRYREGEHPEEEKINAFLGERGFSMQAETLSVSFDGSRYLLEFVTTASGRNRHHLLGRTVAELTQVHPIECFTVARTSRG